MLYNPPPAFSGQTDNLETSTRPPIQIGALQGGFFASAIYQNQLAATPRGIAYELNLKKEKLR